MPISIPVQVRLTLDHMRAEIVHAFSEMDLSADVDRAVRSAVEAFDFEAEIQRVVGDEMRGMLRDGIRRELGRLAWTDEAFRAELAGVIIRAFQRAEGRE